MTTSKIKGVQPNGTWNTNDGATLYKYEYHMEDDTILTAFHKTNAPIAEVGAEVEYEVTKQSARGKSGKVRKPGSFTGGYGGGGGMSRADVQDQIGKQWAIGQAMQWWLATSPDPTQDGLRQVAATARLILEMRDDMEAFIHKYKNVDTNDLPF
jgi:hypothetical protein